jgi:hypothetical protein
MTVLVPLQFIVLRKENPGKFPNSLQQLPHTEHGVGGGLSSVLLDDNITAMDSLEEG